jgi:toxin-antitoxin system PIN domain toxin
VILPDVNLLLYAELASFPEHAAARAWWEDALSGTEEVLLALPSLYGFVRVATNRRVFDPPLDVEDALARVSGWLAQPNARVVLPGPRHLEIAFGLLRAAGAAGNLTTDAQLAAIAIESGATLCSNDTDFARFAGLSWTNPLDAGRR